MLESNEIYLKKNETTQSKVRTNRPNHWILEQINIKSGQTLVTKHLAKKDNISNENQCVVF